MENERWLKSLEQAHFPVTAFSHKGLVRANNEDSFLARAFRADGTDIILAIVADGVGGHQAGEIASRICVEIIEGVVAGCSNLDHPQEVLVRAFVEANREIVRQAQVHEEWRGMGSTCVCALIIGNRMHIANLGDSRLYLLRKEEIRQLTFDHTWMEELSALEIPGGKKLDRSHPLAHVLNRYLGTSDPIQVDLRMRGERTERPTLVLQPGDIVALASDGISDLLTDQEIRENLTCGDWEKTARRLVYKALKKGGHDNATIVAIQVH